MAQELILGLGGHPASLNDLNWLQSAMFFQDNAIVKALIEESENKCILYGCVYASGSITAGAIYYDGKIYEVDAQVIAGTPSTLFFVEEETVGVDNPVTYADSTLKNVHVLKKLKLQAGIGLFSLASIHNITILIKDRLDIAAFLTGYATEAWVMALFATLRNGYDPTFRVNPTTGVLEWAYSSPSHPDAPGTGVNPWRSLGIVIGAVALGTLGIFEAVINTDRSLPVGYYTTPISAEAGTSGYTTVYDIIQFDTEISDVGNNFSLLRRYVAPINSTYDFIFDNLIIECVSTTVPYPSTVIGHTITIHFAFFKNNIEIVGTAWAVDLPAGGNTSGVNPMVLGDILMPSQNYSADLLTNDEITLRFWFSGTSLLTTDVDRAVKQAQLAANARAAYRFTSANFYTI